MTRQKSFKRLVRSWMEKTGESYAAARASLLRAGDQKSAETPALPTSDQSIRRRTGRGWEEWFDLLDEWGAAERTHTEIARWVAEQQSVEPLAWTAQAVTVSYERARGGRAVGEHPDGFSITLEDRDGTGRAALRRVRRRVAPRGLAARREAARANRHKAEVGALRLGRQRDPGQRHIHREGRGQWSGGLLLGLALWIGFPFVLWTGAVIHENTSLEARRDPRR